MRSIALALVSAACLLAVDVAQEGVRWWSYIQVLADDKMEGRNTGRDIAAPLSSWRANSSERDLCLLAHRATSNP